MIADSHSQTRRTVETLAIIPARGNSKGIKRKNLQTIIGKPLIAHTIEAAQKARRVDRVVVSTDDSEIAAIAENFDSQVIMRPSDISGDSAPSESALMHVLDFLKKKENLRPRLLVFLQCTSPLTLPEDIDGTIQALLDGNADSALAAAPFHYFLWQKDHQGHADGINHDRKTRPMRQQRRNQFLEAGSVYVMTVEGFLIHKHRFFGKTVIYEIPPERCFEIDEPVDLRIADVLMRERQQKMSILLLPERIEAVVFDFDGVFTDNRVIVDQNGREAVVCDRSDGMGLSRLKKIGLSVIVLSTEENPVVKERCRKLNITSIQGLKNKKKSLLSWLQEHEINRENVVYLGNDINDIDCLQTVGCSVVVGDAHPDVKQAARLILSKTGGRGAIRELTDLIEKKMEKDNYAKKS
jgi:N-acylneuraminate cytidylyltransferase